MELLHTFFLCLLFFFFQAEDGIRDHCVTGVQTCALPISARSFGRARETARPRHGRLHRGERSEERRVGKEWISRGSRQHYEKTTIDTRTLKDERDEVTERSNTKTSARVRDASSAHRRAEQ